MRVSALRAFDFVTCPLTESPLVICLLMRVSWQEMQDVSFSLQFFLFINLVEEIESEVQSLNYTNKNTFNVRNVSVLLLTLSWLLVKQLLNYYMQISGKK